MTLLRERGTRSIHPPVKQMWDAQRIGHILKQLHLIDESRHKCGMDGMPYAVRLFDMVGILHRYDLLTIYKPC